MICFPFDRSSRVTSRAGRFDLLSENASFVRKVPSILNIKVIRG